MTRVKVAPTKNTKESKIGSILVTQPKPETEKSPYFDIEKKYGVSLQFHPFITIEGISAKDFRRQVTDMQNYTAIILTSRIAVDHFFRICEELRYKVPADMKYFCITEAVALYLQKFVLYRKRKVFFGEDGTIKSLLNVIGKQKTKEKYIIPSSDINKKDIIEYLQAQELDHVEATLYKTICNDCKEVLSKKHDIIIFFSPAGVKSLFENNPDFKQNGTLIGAFGPTTCKAVEESGLTLHIKAPLPNAPSMVAALETYLNENRKGK